MKELDKNVTVHNLQGLLSEVIDTAIEVAEADCGNIQILECVPRRKLDGGKALYTKKIFYSLGNACRIYRKHVTVAPLNSS